MYYYSTERKARGVASSLDASPPGRFRVIRRCWFFCRESCARWSHDGKDRLQSAWWHPLHRESCSRTGMNAPNTPQNTFFQILMWILFYCTASWSGCIGRCGWWRVRQIWPAVLTWCEQSARRRFWSIGREGSLVSKQVITLFSPRFTPSRFLFTLLVVHNNSLLLLSAGTVFIFPSISFCKARRANYLLTLNFQYHLMSTMSCKYSLSCASVNCYYPAY